MSSAISQVPAISVLSPLVTRITDSNVPGTTVQGGGNTYLVGHGQKRVLVVSGEGSLAHAELLDRYLELVGVEIEAILLTHSHEQSQQADAAVRTLISHKRLGSKINRSQIYKYIQATENTSCYAWQPRHFGIGQVYKGAGFTLTGYHTPTLDNDHLTYFLAEESALFCGDNVLTHATILANEKNSPIIVYPSRDHYISYSSIDCARGIEIVNILSSNHKEYGFEASLPITDIVDALSKMCADSVLPPSRSSVYLNLLKLREEKKVVPVTANSELEWRIPAYLQTEAKL